MRVFELNRKQVLGENAWPLKGLHARVDVELDFGDVEVPPKAARRMALLALRELIENAEEEELQTLSRPMHRTGGVPDDERREESEANGWEKPEELDLRVVKSAHRVIQEVAKRGMSGRSVLAADLVGAIGLSAPTLGRLLRDGEPANSYLANFIVVTPHGRTKALDLTPHGRMLASKIRAGVVPS